MTNADKGNFASTMAILQEIFVPDKPISKQKVQVYFDILAPYEMSEIAKAADWIIRTKKYATFPLPAEFKEAMGIGSNEGQIELRALGAWEYACSNYDGREGGVDDPLLDETIRIAFGGWQRFGMTDPDRETLDRKHFIDCFKALAEKEKREGPMEISVLRKLSETPEKQRQIGSETR